MSEEAQGQDPLDELDDLETDTSSPSWTPGEDVSHMRRITKWLKRLVRDVNEIKRGMTHHDGFMATQKRHKHALYGDPDTPGSKGLIERVRALEEKDHVSIMGVVRQAGSRILILLLSCALVWMNISKEGCSPNKPRPAATQASPASK